MPALLPAAQEVAPIISLIGLYRQELVAAMANLAADLQATAPAATTTGSASYLRSIQMLGPESLYGQTVREPTNRDNSYYAPGELSNLNVGGLKSANCNNVHNPSQALLLFGNVPCKVQPPFNWGNGILSAYYPHVTRARVPR